MFQEPLFSSRMTRTEIVSKRWFICHSTTWREC